MDKPLNARCVIKAILTAILPPHTLDVAEALAFLAYACLSRACARFGGGVHGTQSL